MAKLFNKAKSVTVSGASTGITSILESVRDNVIFSIIQATGRSVGGTSPTWRFQVYRADQNKRYFITDTSTARKVVENVTLHKNDRLEVEVSTAGSADSSVHVDLTSSAEAL